MMDILYLVTFCGVKRKLEECMYIYVCVCVCEYEYE